MNWIKKNKWTFWWIVFGIFVIGFIAYVVVHISKNDFNSALLQFGSILIPLFAAIIIMLQNNEQIDKSTKTQLDHLQMLNDREIDEMQKLFQKQIDALTDGTNKQIAEARKMTNDQIETLQHNTSKQIQSNADQTQKIVDELTDNSILLGEILKRELEKGIQHTDQQIQQASKALEDIKSFKLGRTDEEKAIQVKQQSNYIEWLKSWKNRLNKKYNSIIQIFQDEL